MLINWRIHFITLFIITVLVLIYTMYLSNKKEKHKISSIRQKHHLTLAKDISGVGIWSWSPDKSTQKIKICEKTCIHLNLPETTKYVDIRYVLKKIGLKSLSDLNRKRKYHLNSVFELIIEQNSDVNIYRKKWLKCSFKFNNPYQKENTSDLVFGTIMDISEEMRLHHAIYKSAINTKVLAAYNKGILDSLNDGVVTIKSNGAICSANIKFLNMFQLSKNNLKTTYIQNLITLHSSQCVSFSSDFITDDKIKANPIIDAEYHCSSGDLRLLQVTMTQYRNNNKHEYTCLVRDVTEERQLERMKGEFISTVSHEIRTPLTSILGSLKLIPVLMNSNKKETVLSMISIATENGNRLHALINDILDMEKLQTGKLSFEMLEMSSSQILKRASEVCKPLTEKRNIQLMIDDNDPVLMIGDEFRLTQALINLIANAIKFSPNDGIISVITEINVEDQLTISVIDQGPGISEHMKDKVFKKFFQVDASDNRAKSGTGLGLTITKSILEAHTGNVGVKSNPEGGAIFFMSLPYLSHQSIICEAG